MVQMFSVGREVTRKRMNNIRLKEINRNIDSNLRPNTHLANPESYFSCDICWTCKSFDPQANECTLTHDEATIRAGREIRGVSLGYFERVKIKKPLWYRCTVWEER